jgi:uncharacterized membrane protein
MTRILYRSLLGLHPTVFRRRFAQEMLCIFDEVAAEGTTAALIADAFVSLGRQWLFRSGAWIAIAAVLGAFIQVTVGGFSFFLFTRGPGLNSPRVYGTAAPMSPAAAELIQLMLWTSGSLVVIVLLTTLWIRNFTRRIDGH